MPDTRQVQLDVVLFYPPALQMGKPKTVSHGSWLETVPDLEFFKASVIALQGSVSPFPLELIPWGRKELTNVAEEWHITKIHRLNLDIEYVCVRESKVWRDRESQREIAEPQKTQKNRERKKVWTG